MANAVRGEAEIKIDGKSFTVVLGLGALAEIEDEFGVENFEQALDFSIVSARKLRKFMRALMRGNGIDLTHDLQQGIDRMPVEEFMAIIAKVMGRSGLMDGAVKQDGEPAAPLAVRKGGKRG